MQTPEDQLIETARRQHIGIFIDARARRAGLPFIRFLKDGACLAEFEDVTDAFNWFPKIDSPGAAGKSIQSSANF